MKPARDAADLQVVVVAAEVRRDVVFVEQRVEALEQTLRGAVLGHGPHRVVARHQQEVRFGPSQSLLQPDQLTVGLGLDQRASGLLVHKVVGVAAEHHRVEHDDGQGLPRVGDAVVQLVVVGGESPDGGVKEL